jgi:glycine cleavage system transcriptional repressor
MPTAVIATVAADRPGLVSELSELVLSLELNIEDSRMTVLGGEFAVLMAVAGSEAALDSLESTLGDRSQAADFVYLFRRTDEKAGQPGRRLTVRVEAMDHPGIVHGVANFFSRHGANIQELTTDTERAPHTGAPVFNLEMEVELPDPGALEGLERDFQSFCAREGLDGELVEGS